MNNEELHYVYTSLSIIKMMKSRRMRWEGHVARMGEMSNAYQILVGKPDGKRTRGRTRRKGKIILEWILGNRVGRCELDSSGSG